MDMNNSDDQLIQTNTPKSNPSDKETSNIVRQTFLKTLTGKTITLDVTTDSTIGAIKSIISQKEGVPIQYIRARYAGKLLQDDKTLISYGYDPGRIHWHIKFPKPPLTVNRRGKHIKYCVSMVISVGIICVGSGVLADSQINSSSQLSKEFIYGSIIFGIGLFVSTMTAILWYKDRNLSITDDRTDIGCNDNNPSFETHF
jgi:hypothetical protein